MTYKENITAILECYFTGFKKEIIDSACDRIVGQEPCNDAISREWLKIAIHNFYYGLKHTPTEEDIQVYIDAAPLVIPQPKMGCEGCICEKTGNNSTYPCSHCSRCYTDKYKVESEG